MTTTNNDDDNGRPATPKRQPVFTTDANGAPLVAIPLANHPHPAVMDREDFDAMQALRFPFTWTLNAADPKRRHSYVRAYHPRAEATGQLITPARIIAGAARGQRVRYRDGDRLNLRRSNLFLCGFLAGHAKGREAAIVAKRGAA